MNAERVRVVLWLSSGVVIGLSLGVAGGVFAGREAAGGEAMPAWMDKGIFGEVVGRVKREYVDDVPSHRLVESALRGMVAGLDEHSRLLSVVEYETVRQHSSGSYAGVGLDLEVRDGRLVVTRVIDDTPAARAGIRAGDALLAIDGRAVRRTAASAAIRRLRGPEGTSVGLTLSRAGLDVPLSLSLERSRIDKASVSASMAVPGRGYVRISQFTDHTGSELRRALRDLEAENGGPLTGLVLDLRDNPGGVLAAAVDVADTFLERGLVVTATGRGRGATFRHSAQAGDHLAGRPLVVLVNGGTASAAEIVAGALQDHGRATITGLRTFGKGSVQTVIPLSDGRALKLTTSRYFRPGGTSIQGTGIAPDVPFDAAGAPRAGWPTVASSDPAVRRALRLLSARPPAVLHAMVH